MNKWIWAGVLWAVAGTVLAADVAATLIWSQRVELSPRVSGIVRAVGVKAGDRVKKGQELLALDAGIYEAGVMQARAAVARYSEELLEAERDLKRTQELFDRTVIAMTELDQAKLRLARARAQRDGARAQLARAQKDLADSALRAPFDAVVVARLAEPGQYAAVGLQPQPLLILAKAGEMLAQAGLTEEQAGRLKPGQAVSVTVAQQKYAGSVRNIGLEPVAGSRERGGAIYSVDFVFPSGDAILRAGATALVTLP
ncbi:MAG: efflux RND transporter periplasmic adaptor subunit [Sulfuricella sp.]